MKHKCLRTIYYMMGTMSEMRAMKVFAARGNKVQNGIQTAQEI